MIRAFSPATLARYPLSSLAWLVCYLETGFYERFNKLFLREDYSLAARVLSVAVLLAVFIVEHKTKNRKTQAGVFFAGYILLGAAITSWHFFPEYKYLPVCNFLFAVGILGMLPQLYARGEQEVWNEQMIFSQVAGYALVASVAGLIAHLAVIGLIAFVFDKRFDDLMSTFVAACFAWFPVLLVLHRVRPGKLFRITPIVVAVLQYVVLPLWAFYVLLLNIYALKILVHWHLPDGNVAVPVVAAFQMGFVIRWSSCGEQIEIFRNKFLRYGMYLQGPLLVLFSVGLYRRISDYGFTQNRYFLLLILLACSLFYAAEIGKKFSARWAPLALMVFSALAFIPI